MVYLIVYLSFFQQNHVTIQEFATGFNKRIFADFTVYTLSH